MTDAEIKQDGNAENESEQSQGQEIPSDFEPLTATYERLRHSTDAAPGVTALVFGGVCVQWV